MKGGLVLPLSVLLLSRAMADAAPLLDFANGPGEKIKLSVVSGVPTAIGVQDAVGFGAMYFRSESFFNWYVRGSHIDNGVADVGAGPGGIFVAALGASEGGTFACANFLETSDRNVKENIGPVDGRKVLDQLLSLPIHTWSFTNGHSGVRNIGPMAQDFYATFKFGADDKHIASRNTAGVALAAVQGLHQIVQEQRIELDRKEARIAELEKRMAKMDSLEERVKQLEGALKDSLAGSNDMPLKSSRPDLSKESNGPL